MSTDPTDEPVVVYTIGHSNHPLEKLLALLSQHEIGVLLDTRSSPYCRYATHFSQPSIRDAVEGAGIRYIYMGKELGGRPEGDEFYDEEGHVDYARVAESAPFKGGIDRVLRGVRKHRVALLCSEEDPLACHRRLLVTRVLSERGVEPRHIRGDGQVQSEEMIVQEEKKSRKDTGQLSLFESEETPAWKSVRSVLDRKTRQPSSDF
ncbi:MAG TPA: DUF488 domain-containing protein [Armatimonadota bacterium]|nr:DUF488 domain-containing protein [Armatimonadota bacterium]